MRALLIDPYTKTITEVEHDDTLQNIYKHIQADCIDMVRINNKGDCVLVDDEGLYRQDAYFAIENYLQPLAGRGLVLGTGSQGESTAPAEETVETLENKISWINRDDAIKMGEELDELNAANKKLYGDRYIVVGSVADMIRDREYTEPSE